MKVNLHREMNCHSAIIIKAAGVSATNRAGSPFGIICLFPVGFFSLFFFFLKIIFNQVMVQTLLSW